MTDVNSHGLGIEGVNQETLRVQNVTIIPRNTQLPYEVTRKFVTKVDNQRSVKVQLLEGDSTLPDQCSPLAVAAIKHLPPGLPKGTPIKVTYRFEANGRLSVNAAVAGVGDAAQIELERVRGLTQKRVNSWKRVICQDGGYRDFEEALATLLLSDGFSETPKRTEAEKPVEATHQSEKRKSDLEAAIDHGAPLAASNRLKDQRQAVVHATKPHAPEPGHEDTAAPKPRTVAYTKSNDHRLPIWGVLLGHVIAGAVGLALGYYLLCWVRPDLNMLNLNLPGLSVTDDPVGP